MILGILEFDSGKGGRDSGFSKSFTAVLCRSRRSNGVSGFVAAVKGQRAEVSRFGVLVRARIWFGSSYVLEELLES